VLVSGERRKAWEKRKVFSLDIITAKKSLLRTVLVVSSRQLVQSIDVRGRLNQDTNVLWGIFRGTIVQTLIIERHEINK